MNLGSETSLPVRLPPLVVAGVVCMLAASPPIDFWPLGLVAWVPLALIALSTTPSRAAAAAWLHGTVAQLLTLRAMPHALHDVAGAPVLGSLTLTLALAAFEGGRFAAVAFLAARGAGNGWSPLLAFPIALAAGESWYPLVFPWTSALFLHSVPVLLQGAELVGASFVSIWVGLFAASLAVGWRRCRCRGPGGRSALAIALATLASVAAGGAVRMRAIDGRAAAADALRLGVVQGDVPRDATEPTAELHALTTGLMPTRPELVVWPESAIPFPVRVENLPGVLSRSVFRDPTRVREPAIDVPILLGAVVEKRAEPSSAQAAFVRERSQLWVSAKAHRMNAAILAMPDGTVAGEYDKQTLVPFGEYVPFESRWPWLRRLTPRAGDFDRGFGSSVIGFQGKRLLVRICYEDILAERFRADVEASKPDLLVDISSDAWFIGSGVPALHAALAQLRAIEHRRYLVHATNTGLTLVVDPVGREVLRLPSERRAAATADVRWLRARTAYESLGSTPSIGLAVATGLLALLRRRPARLA